MTKAKLIVGCGYLGQRVARAWLAAGETVYAVTRSLQRAEALRRQGIKPLVADVTRPETLTVLPEADTVLYCVGYDGRSAASRTALYFEGLRAVTNALPREPRRLIYTSSTGVYGPSATDWVSEESPCEPTRESGQAMLAGERFLLSHPSASRTIILRLAGLYGPERIPLAADLRAGKPIAVSSAGCINLIHVDDACAAVIAASNSSLAPRIYNVSDGHPTPRRQFYAHLAELLGYAPPEFIEPTPGLEKEGRGGGQKKVNSARMLAELKVRLAYPTYREGLAAIILSVQSVPDIPQRSA